MLGDPDKKSLYDSSYGLGSFKNFIRSKTVMLTDQNYDRLVAKSHDVWVVQVFDHDSSICRSYADSWEAMAAKYSFLKFGRVDQRTQQTLVHRLPFRPLEYPFIFVYHQASEPDFVDYKLGQDINRVLLQTIKDTLPTQVQLLSLSEFSELVEQPQTGTALVYLNKNGFDDVLFLFESRVMSRVRFASTQADKHALVLQYLHQKFPNRKAPRYVLVHAAGSRAAHKFGSIEFVFEPYHMIANRVKYIDIPMLSSSNVNHLCPAPAGSESEHQDHLCLILLDRNTSVLEDLIQREFLDSPQSSTLLLTRNQELRQPDVRESLPRKPA